MAHKKIITRVIIYSFILYSVFIWIFSTVLISPYRSKSSGTPIIFNIPYENSVIKTPDGKELSCWWIKNPKTDKCIILCHGLGTDKSDMLSFIPFLRKAGYNLLVFDFRGHGDNKGGFTTLGYYEINDVLGAVKFAKEKNIKSIGALGISMGAASIVMAAVKTDDIRAVVSDSAYSNLSSMIKRYAKRIYHIPYFPSVPLVEFVAGIRTGADYSAVNPAEEIKNLNVPVFIIHGVKDENIPVENGKIIFEAAKEPKELFLVPNAFHVESHATAQKEYEARVLKFFGKYL